MFTHITSEKDIQEMRKLRKTGVLVADIAKKFKVSKDTVTRYTKDVGLSKIERGEIKSKFRKECLGCGILISYKFNRCTKCARKLDEKPENSLEDTICNINKSGKHRYAIDNYSSIGYCKFCGKQKEFPMPTYTARDFFAPTFNDTLHNFSGKAEILG